MIHFRNDYNDLAHPDILEFMMKHAHEAHLGYGMDEHVKKAKINIQKHLKEPVFMHFMSGGTSTNKIVISHLLKPYEAVISASTGHIEVHETGAIESTGHKIISIPTIDGKLTPELIEKKYLSFTDEHMVKPKMVYISNATETGLSIINKNLKISMNSVKNFIFIFL